MDKIAMYKEEIVKMASQKKDDAKRDNDTETRMWRDRVKPEYKRTLKSIPRGIGAGVLAGAAVGAATKGNPVVTGLASSGGALAGMVTKKRELEKKELNRLSNKYLGKDATKKQHDTVRNKSLASAALMQVPNPGASLAGSTMSFTKTPESVIQRARRENANQ